MFIIAKVVDGKIIDIYNQKTYKVKKNAFTVLNGFQYVGVLMEYKIYHLTGLEEVVQ